MDITQRIARHGLYVKEAIMHTDRAIQEAQSRGDTEIHLIVGPCLLASLVGSLIISCISSYQARAFTAPTRRQARASHRGLDA